MIIDAHVKLGKTFRGESLEAKTYLEWMETERIDKAVLCPNKPATYMVSDGNRYVSALLREDPDRFWGAIRLNPWDGQKAITEMESRLDENSGFKAIYLNPWEEQFQCNDPVVFPIMDRVQKLKLPVIIEAGYPWVSQIFQIADLARRYDTVKFFATNAGQLDLSGSTLGDVARVMDRSRNIHLGSAGACGAQWMADLERQHPGKIIFETNYPLMEPHLEVFRVEHGFLEEEEKQRIFSENLLSLFDIRS